MNPEGRNGEDEMAGVLEEGRILRVISRNRGSFSGLSWMTSRGVSRFKDRFTETCREASCKMVSSQNAPWVL